MLTAHDLQMQLLDFIGGAADTLAVTKARRALRAAISDLAQRRQWTYFIRSGRLVTEASQTTGTVVYDHTGGTYERMLTLTGATWPTNAAKGFVVVKGIRYEVESRQTSTVLTLREETNPGADVASTTYLYARDRYALPVRVNAMSSLQEHGQSISLKRVSATEMLTFRHGTDDSGQPTAFALGGDGQVTGQIVAVLYPPPDAVYRFDYVYRLQPDQIQTFDYTTGTVACAASTTVTGTGTTFTDAMIGSVLRLGSVTSEPDDAAGSNPYAYESLVTAVASATSLTIQTAPTGTYTGVKYRISDHVDIEEGAMTTALLRLAEMQMAILVPKDGRETTFRASLADRAFRMACEADNRRLGGREPFYRIPLGEMPVGSDLA